MTVSGWLKVGPKMFLFAGLMLAVGITVACGSSATATAIPTTAPTATVATPGVGVPTAIPATATTPTGEPVRQETVTIMNAVWGNERFAPRDAVGEVATYGRALHGYLVAGNERSEMIPGIASEWSISEDGLIWDFKIRDGVKFHDGSDLTLDDVVFTMDHTFGPEAATSALEASLASMAKATSGIEGVGTDTLRITHTKPFASFLFLVSEMVAPNSGAIMPKAYFEQVELDGYNRDPIGAGAFKMDTYKPDEQILLERFEDHYYQPDNGFSEDRRPKFQTLDLRLVSSLPTRVAALAAGNVDIIESNIAVRKQIERGGSRIIFSQESSYTWLFIPGCWKVELVCSKKDVREALDYAIDRQLIIDQLYSADSAVAKGWTAATPSALGYSPDLDPVPFDPVKAQELMARAGYPNGDGFPKLTIHTWEAGDVPFMPEQAEVIAKMWEDNLGIEVEVVVGDANTVRGRWLGRELDGEVIFRTNEARWDGGSNFNALYGTVDSAARVSEDPVLRAAMNEAFAVTAPELRQDAFNKVYKQLRDSHYDLSTLYVNLPWGVSSRIETWEPWPLAPYQTALWTIELK